MPHADAHITRVVRLAAVSGNRDHDYFQAACSCGWRARGTHSNQTVEGRRLAIRDAQDHAKASA